MNILEIISYNIKPVLTEKAEVYFKVVSCILIQLIIQQNAHIITRLELSTWLHFNFKTWMQNWEEYHCHF
jgi:hypothetical protein